MASGGLLFSSPVRAQADSLIVLSSSPEFPSISELIPKTTRRPPLRSGSRAAPIPDDAPKTFTTAASLWRSLDNDEDIIEVDFEKEVKPPARKTTRKPVATSPINFSRDVPPKEKASLSRPTRAVEKEATKIPEQKAMEIVEALPLDDPATLAKEKTRKKTKSAKDTKDTKDGQTKMPKGKVTKPTVKGKSGRKSEVVSRHFRTNTPPAEQIEIEDTIELEPALKRRTDWTPTQDTGSAKLQLDSSPVKEVTSPSLHSGKSAVVSSDAVFKTLRDTYGCKQDEVLARVSSDVAGAVDVLRKRKQLDLLTTSEAKTPETSPVRSKAPKKKPRTITELATAAYRVPQDQDEAADAKPPPGDSLLRYLDADDGGQTGGTGKTVAGKGKIPKKRAKPKTAKKVEPPRQRLLSPASAMRQVSNQDFVFGTSSQLATEQDPGLLRDLQEAMRISNQENDDDVFATPLRSEKFDRPSGNRLWAAGARDTKGDLLSIEVIDLVDSPAILKDLTNPAVINTLVADSAPKQDTKKGQAEPAAPEVKPLDLGNSARCTNTKPRLLSTLEQIVPLKASVPLASAKLPLYPAANSVLNTMDLGDEPPASNQEQNQLMELIQETSTTSSHGEGGEAPRPKYELYTDGQLATALRGYGFKVVKRRTAMIALLDQCWASKNKAAQGSHVPTAALSTSSTTQIKAAPAASAPSATRPRGRPRKETGASTAPSTAMASTSTPASPAKRPRGRPRKDSKTATQPKVTKTKAAASKIAVPQPRESPQLPKASTISRPKAVARSFIEIADSESEDASVFNSSRSASPEPEKTFSSPLPADVSIDEGSTDLSLTASPTSREANLFEFITKAVTTAPRSVDARDPSWHEKMLMYDPVVLEDLAAWLNSGQLDRVGYDSEVAPGEVKKWCESKSVCCLWRFNLNGQERKRF
ncbi:hypothetical protein QBC33DRAFT_550484 [Phialemonium atrogriseum]|uniref:Structure-specific endonuclease subunit SLX4 n=1 Tax=Phialemonium atrogriseum TaxID=1093897 RepID=A0AAJ0BRH7_9PEZI|nr:uncharacterized protein QBC33DRAFT_550484 [Phialemonium atrogriseum]KAK1763134.1 hypothetical protein QBC33DRAFT_550484 [Phialemonium atrogriseum]